MVLFNCVVVFLHLITYTTVPVCPGQANHSEHPLRSGVPLNGMKYPVKLKSLNAA